MKKQKQLIQEDKAVDLISWVDCNGVTWWTERNRKDKMKKIAKLYNVIPPYGKVKNIRAVSETAHGGVRTWTNTEITKRRHTYMALTSLFQITL